MFRIWVAIFLVPSGVASNRIGSQNTLTLSIWWKPLLNAISLRAPATELPTGSVSVKPNALQAGWTHCIIYAGKGYPPVPSYQELLAGVMPERIMMFTRKQLLSIAKIDPGGL